MPEIRNHRLNYRRRLLLQVEAKGSFSPQSIDLLLIQLARKPTNANHLLYLAVNSSGRQSCGARKANLTSTPVAAVALTDLLDWKLSNL